LSGADLYPDIPGAIRSIRNLRHHPYGSIFGLGSGSQACCPTRTVAASRTSFLPSASMQEQNLTLADSELVGGFRLRMVLTHDRPPLTGYDQDLWAGRLRYRDVEVRDAFEQFSAIRRANVRIWQRLSPTDFNRPRTDVPSTPVGPSSLSDEGRKRSPRRKTRRAGQVSPARPLETHEATLRTVRGTPSAGSGARRRDSG
jgi:hypothetical protein